MAKYMKKLEEKMVEEGKAFLDNLGDYLAKLCEEQDTEKKLKFYSYFFKQKEYFKEQIESEVSERVEDVKEEAEKMLRRSKKRSYSEKVS